MIQLNFRESRDSIPNSPRKTQLLAALTLIFLVGLGCNTVNLSPGTAMGIINYTYAYGKGSQGFPYSASVVQTALYKAMADLNMQRAVSETAQDGTLNITAVAANRKMVNVSILSQPSFSLVTARVGGLGDRQVTANLFQRLNVYLTGTSGATFSPSPNPKIVETPANSSGAANPDDGFPPISGMSSSPDSQINPNPPPSNPNSKPEAATGSGTGAKPGTGTGTGTGTDGKINKTGLSDFGDAQSPRISFPIGEPNS